MIGFHIMFLFSFVSVLDGYFDESFPEPSGWTHAVLDYLGPNDGQRISIYNNEEKVARDTTKAERLYSAADGRIVVGRRFKDKDQDYASVQVDELIYFNQALTNEDIQSIFDSD